MNTPKRLPTKSSTRSTSFFGMSHGMLLAAAAAVAVLGGVTLLSGASDKPVLLSDLKQQTHYHGLAVDRADPSRLLLATHHGFYIVNKDGVATRVSPVQDFMGFTPHPTNKSILFASGHPSGGGNMGFLRSDDGGISWKQVSPGLGGPVDFHQMDVSPADSNVVYGSFRGIQVSRDGGQNWSMAGPGPDGLIALAASRANPDRVYAATKSGLQVSADAGKSWSPAAFEGQVVGAVGIGSGANVFAFVVGKGLQQGNDGSPNNWSLLSNDFGDRVLLHLAVDPTDSARMYASTDDNSLLASTDGGHSWHPFGAK